MEIHTYEKLWFGLGLLLIVAFIGTITYGAVGAGIQMISDDGGTVDPGEINDHEKFEQQEDEFAVHVEDNEYEVAVQALQFGFNPGSANLQGPITVPEDSKVTFYVTSPDVIHGLDIVGTNVNTMVIPGQMAEFTVEFDELDDDEPKEYDIVCNEFCGAGHEDMEGNLVVLPQDEFEQAQAGDDEPEADDTEDDETGDTENESDGGDA